MHAFVFLEKTYFPERNTCALALENNTMIRPIVVHLNFEFRIIELTRENKYQELIKMMFNRENIYKTVSEKKVRTSTRKAIR